MPARASAPAAPPRRHRPSSGPAPRLSRAAATISLAAMLAACAGSGPQDIGAERQGVSPLLPEPAPQTLPRVRIAPATPAPAGWLPTAAPGTSVKAFATGLDHPRWLHVLPNGDVLVAETNAPPRPLDASGPKGWAMKIVMKLVGAGVPSADRLTLLRDTDGDGVADRRSVFASGLTSPFGMALIGQTVYVANSDAVVALPYRDGDTVATAAPRRVTDLPAGPRNHHWTKGLVASADGRYLYASVGSNSNIAEHGMAEEEGRAAIWRIDVATGAKTLYATGLRNPVGMAWEPASGRLWTVVNERDELGDDLVPDYLTAVDEGAFYGWPYSYYGARLDPRVQPQRPDLVGRARSPDFALGSHVAALGLASSEGSRLPAAVNGGMYIGEHGSWNRKPLSGYQVVLVPFADGKPAGPKRTVLSGFVSDDGKAYGRPVGVAVDRRGALLVADDVGNTVWRVSATDAATAATAMPR